MPYIQQLSILRAAYLDEEEDPVKLDLGTEVFHELGMLPPFSSRNELRVMKALSELCRKRLDGYPSTLQGDLDQLEQGNLTPNQRNTLLLKIEEKRVLLFVIEMSAAVSDILLAAKSEAIEQIRNGEAPAYLEEYLVIEILPMLEEESGLPLSGFGIQGGEDMDDGIVDGTEDITEDVRDTQVDFEIIEDL